MTHLPGVHGRTGTRGSGTPPAVEGTPLPVLPGRRLLRRKGQVTSSHTSSAVFGPFQLFHGLVFERWVPRVGQTGRRVFGAGAPGCCGCGGRAPHGAQSSPEGQGDRRATPGQQKAVCSLKGGPRIPEGQWQVCPERVSVTAAAGVVLGLESGCRPGTPAVPSGPHSGQHSEDTMPREMQGEL